MPNAPLNRAPFCYECMQTDSKSRQLGKEETNKEIVLKFYADASSRAAEELLAEDFIGHSLGVPPFDREGFKQALSELYSAFPDGRYINDDVIAEGDKVVTFGRFQGTHKGAFHGIPPSGKKVTLTAVHIDRVLNGKIVEHLRVSDSGELMRQLRPEVLATS